MTKASMSILPIAFAYLLSVSGVEAGNQYFVSPYGEDLNDCMSAETPCKTARAAVRKMPLGHYGLNLAPGTYDEVIDVSHGKQVFIHGPFAGSSCPDPSRVFVKSISVQDNATIWAGCLTTQQIGCRQWSIADVADVVFNGDGVIALVISETCRINTDGTLWVNANIAAFATLDDYSTLYLGGAIIINRPGLTPYYFVNIRDSKVDMRGATFSGYPLASGLRFVLDHGIIEFPAVGGAGAIPGNGSTARNFSICRPCD